MNGTRTRVRHDLNLGALRHYRWLQAFLRKIGVPPDHQRRRSDLLAMFELW
jgi:hypothetical protein